MSITPTISGIVVEDAPAYLLYKDTLRYVEKNILPISHRCSRCKSTLTIDMARDIYYRHDVWNQAYYDQLRKYNEWTSRYTYLKPDNEHFNPDKWYSGYHTPQLCIACPVCDDEQFITSAIQQRCADVSAVLACYRNLRGGKYQQQERQKRIAWGGGIALAVTLVLLVGWWLFF